MPGVLSPAPCVVPLLPWQVRGGLCPLEKRASCPLRGLHSPPFIPLRALWSVTFTLCLLPGQMGAHGRSHVAAWGHEPEI